MTTGASGIVALIAVLIALTAILLILVVIAKVRRDQAERTSAEFRSRIANACAAADAQELNWAFTEAARGRRREQPDLLLALRAREAGNPPDSTWEQIAQEMFAESGLEARLTTQLTSPRAVQRGLAASLGALRTTRLPTSVIAPLLDDVDPTVRLAAAGALEAHASHDAAIALIAGMTAERLDPPRAIERLGHPWAVDAITAALPGQQPNMQAHLIEAIALAEEPRSIPLLFEFATNSPSDEVRVRAAKAIAACLVRADQVNVRVAEQFARNHLTDPLPLVRGSCAQILGTIANPDDVPLLAGALEDDDWFVRRNAARALISLGPLGVARLESIATSDDAYAASRARQELALASMGQRSTDGRSHRS